MGVVRIDDELLKKLKDILKREENKYKYGSVAALVNCAIYEKLNQNGVKK
jgi:hypothetical protein